jgi:hypothetical protein
VAGHRGLEPLHGFLHALLHVAHEARLTSSGWSPDLGDRKGGTCASARRKTAHVPHRLKVSVVEVVAVAVVFLRVVVAAGGRREASVVRPPDA